MSLLDRLNEDMKTAMKAKDKERLSVIRMVKAAIKNLEIEKRTSLTEEEVISVVVKELKQKEESIAEFKKAGRDEVVTKLEAEALILKEYLPEPLSEEEILAVIDKAIEEVDAKGPSDMGKVMGKVIPETKGKADGKLVNELVRKRLT